MEWITQLNDTIDYIEQNLTTEIDYEKLAQIAGCSSFYYQRMFAYMARVPLSEYIRRRKMTLAAVDLQDGAKVIDIAMKYGYSSPTSFNRAFQSIHNITPSKVKEMGVSVKSFPPISFKITINGSEAMDYRIEKKEAFRIVGISQLINADIENNFKEIPQMWGRAAENGTIEKLIPFMNSQPMGVLGISVCNDQEPWRYYIAVATDIMDSVDFEFYTVPPATWAIFSGEGTGISIQELERRIFTEWMPASGYKYGNAADIEVYLDPSPQNTKYEVWVPVVKNTDN